MILKRIGLQGFRGLWRVCQKILGFAAWLICVSQANFAVFFMVSDLDWPPMVWFLVMSAFAAHLTARGTAGRLKHPVFPWAGLLFCGLVTPVLGLLLHLHDSPWLVLGMLTSCTFLVEFLIRVYPPEHHNLPGWNKVGLVLACMVLCFGATLDVDLVVKFAVLCGALMASSVLYHQIPANPYRGLYNPISIMALSIMACSAVILTLQDLRWEKILFAAVSVALLMWVGSRPR